MTLKLYAHPLSSYCHKAIIAFYENETPFELKLVRDPTKTDPAVAAEFKKLWPIGKFPVLMDEGRDWFVPESTIIIEYLARHYPGKTKLVPKRPDDVANAKQRLTTALDMIEAEAGSKPWAMGDAYTMVDCAASPALFYGHMAMPFDKTHPKTFAYRQRLMERASYAHALKKAEPFFHLLPK